jgi:adenylosuccinate synthase
LARYNMPMITMVLGALYGDEGKGRVAHAMAPKFSLLVRATGGANASHTVWHRGHKITVRQLPSGALWRRPQSLLAAGMLVDPVALVTEMKLLASHGADLQRVRISDRCTVVTPLHQHIDAQLEHDTATTTGLGTTRQGIGPAMIDKVRRVGLRMGELHDRQRIDQAVQHSCDLHPQFAPRPAIRADMVQALHQAGAWLSSHVCDGHELLHRVLRQQRSVLVEGAQGTMLDIDHGHHPHVTSTHPTAGGVLASMGAGPQEVQAVIGVVRTYATRQAKGAFPSEMSVEDERWFRSLTGEHVLRVGWLDAVALRRSAELNGITGWAITSVDRTASLPLLRMVTQRRTTTDLPPTKRPTTDEPFVDRLAKETGIPVQLASASPTGPLLRMS